MNGIRGVFTPDGISILIIDGPPTGEECIAFFEEPSRLFSFRKQHDGHCSFDEPLDVKSKIQILRKGEVDLSDKIINNVSSLVNSNSPPRDSFSNTTNNTATTTNKTTTPPLFGTSPKNDFSLLNNNNHHHADDSSSSEHDVPSQVRLYLISQPITYSGCAWTQDEKSYRPTTTTNGGGEQQKKSFSRSYSMVFENDGDKDFVSVDNVNSPLGGSTKPISISRNNSVSLPNSAPNSVPISSSLEENFISDHVEYSINEAETKLFIRTNGFEKTKSKAPTPLETESKINQIIDNHNTGNDNQLFEKKAEPKETTSAFSNEKKDYKFDFKSFLQKLKDKSVVQLTRDIKKFTFEISNTSDFTPEHPQKVQSFLAQIMREISSHEQWRNATEQDLMNAREGIEKYVMTKIYSKVFSPTLEDIEIDNQIGSRLALFKRVVTPENLDVSPRLITDPLFQKAVEELKKMSFYKTPRDKLICVSNCCHLTMNLLKRSMQEQSSGGGNAPSADDFLPLLIFIVLRSNVPHLHSNIKYICEYRNPQSLEGHAGYFLTSLESAMAFWQGCDHTMLNMDETTFQQMINFEDVFGKESVHVVNSNNKESTTTEQITDNKNSPNSTIQENIVVNHDTIDSVKTPEESETTLLLSPSISAECDDIKEPISEFNSSQQQQHSIVETVTSTDESSSSEIVNSCTTTITTNTSNTTVTAIDQARVEEPSTTTTITLQNDKWENLVTFVKSNPLFDEFKFENATADDLRLKDVNSLLEEYKQMASILKFIKSQTNVN